MDLQELYIYTLGILSVEFDLRSLFIASIGLERLVFEETDNLNGTDFQLILKRVQKNYSRLPMGTKNDSKLIADKFQAVIEKIEGLLSTSNRSLRSQSEIKFGEILYEYENKVFPSKNPKMLQEVLQIASNYEFNEIPDYPEQETKIRECLKPGEAF
jgi:hypothetical protein